MNISIRSEADSRILLYPLIRSLYNFGTICVITNNVNMRRLIDVDSMEGGFRNVRVIVQPDGDLEEAMDSDDMYRDKYDFTIFDNMGATDYDIELIIITSRVSESYLQDIVWIIGEEGTYVFRFGAGAPAPKKNPKEKRGTKKVQKHAKGKNAENEEDVDESEAEDTDDIVKHDEDDVFNNVIDAKANQTKVTGFNEDGSIKNKWTAEKTDAEILNEKLAKAQAQVLPFPSFEDIEKMEARWILPKVESKLAKTIYKIFGPYISVDERSFMKGVSTVDEGGYFISGADVR